MGTYWNLFLIFIQLQAGVCGELGKYFTRSPQSIVAPPGDRVTFQCETSPRMEQVRWKLNNRFLSEAEPEIRISGSFLVVKVSKVRERYMQQVGDYQCVAEFGGTSLTSLPAQLSIAQLDPWPLDKSNNTLEVVEGNPVAIPCLAPYSNPAPFIQFFRDGKPLESETPRAIVTDSGLLHIFNSSVTDSGNYWCSATNHITTDSYPSPFLTRLVVLPNSLRAVLPMPPTFLTKPKPLIVTPSDGNISLECVAVGVPPPKVTWKSEGRILPSPYGTLTLSGVEGDFTCEANNGIGPGISSKVTISLQFPPTINKPPISQIVEEGGEAHLDCVAEGNPKPRISWVFNGVGLHEDGNIQFKEWGLVISRVEKAHAGLFQCFAGNSLGSVYSPAEVRVLPKTSTIMQQGSNFRPRVPQPAELLKEDLSPDSEGEEQEQFPEHHKYHRKHGGHKRRKHGKGGSMTPPSKPIMNRVTDNSVMVRWAVAPNGGYPIQFFKIQYKELAKRNGRWMTIDEDIPPHIHSYEVTDLKLGHAYKFRIAAVYSNNDNKVGPNSEKFVLQKESGAGTRRPMYAPVITNALPFNNTAILLRWKHMKYEPGGVDGVFIYYRESTSASEYSKVTVLGADSDSFYISFLSPGISYDIKIQSFNRAGASGFSSIISAKTTGQASTEKPDMDISHTDKELLIPDEELPEESDHLYVLFGSLFIGFWVVLCVSCALCYKCKQKRAEQEAKYPSGVVDPCLDHEGVKGHQNNHEYLNGHMHPGYISTITSQLDEKETSFVESFNNNRPISPCDLNSVNLAPCDFSSFKSDTMELDLDFRRGDTELQIMTSLGKKSIVDARNCNSLHRKKNAINSNLSNSAHKSVGSLRKLPYVSCSAEDLDDCERGSRIFPKEHYKVSRKHNRRKNCGSNGNMLNAVE